MNANEFVHATPKEIGKDTVVITASQRGNTAETVKATAVANELGAATGRSLLSRYRLLFLILHSM
ncbi:MAG: hypothetical protein ACLTN0_03305 [Coprococcus phoceensis]